jgi:hypothetical protein
MNPFLVPIVLFAVIGSVIVLLPIARALGRRMDRASVKEVPDHVNARLERMEQSLDAIAEQVERVAEGQRFTTKLLSERTPAKVAELRGE